ncbi:MAG: FAD:protein FMN transferase [Clostridiaceae bacterium]|nr:FAD:protein FMN transferase [Clostridiaceae bacterium]
MSETFMAMDTVMEITAYGADSSLMEAAKGRIKELEGLFSVTDENSEIYDLNQTGSAELSPDTLTLVTKALDICRETDGAVDITIYPVVKAWGFTTGNYRIPDSDELKNLLENVRYEDVAISGNIVTIPQGTQVDLGSVAKGYTGDVISVLLKDGGVTSALLDLGGNIQAVGSRPDGSAWRVAVQNPKGEGYVGVLSVSDKAVITSGGYERYFEDDNGNTYWHILDPKTGSPAQNGLISVTIVGDEGVVCDGLSTALFVIGLDKASALWREQGGFEAVLVSEDGRVYITEGLEDCFEPELGIGLSVIEH